MNTVMIPLITYLLLILLTSCQVDTIDGSGARDEASQSFTKDIVIETNDLVEFSGIRLDVLNRFKDVYGLIGFIVRKDGRSEFAYLAWQPNNARDGLARKIMIPFNSPALFKFNWRLMSGGGWAGVELLDSAGNPMGAIRYLDRESTFKPNSLELFTEDYHSNFYKDSYRLKDQIDLCNGAYAYKCKLKVTPGDVIANAKVEHEITNSSLQPTLMEVKRDSKNKMSLKFGETTSIGRVAVSYDKPNKYYPWSNNSDPVKECVKVSPNLFECPIGTYQDSSYFELTNIRVMNGKVEEESTYDEMFQSKDSYIGTDPQHRFPSIYKY